VKTITPRQNATRPRPENARRHVPEARRAAFWVFVGKTHDEARTDAIAGFLVRQGWGFWRAGTDARTHRKGRQRIVGKSYAPSSFKAGGSVALRRSAWPTVMVLPSTGGASQ
jgi:hypothetical protein